MHLTEKRLACVWTAGALSAATALGRPDAALAQSPSAYDRLETCIRQRADVEGFSGVISAVDHDRPLVMVARGERAGPHSAGITPDTRFNIGSASKMFTAVAVGQLLDAGKLTLDDPVGKYVAGLTPEASTVTIRQLLTHTSGMGNFFKPENFEAMGKARSASDILPLIARDKPEFSPGDHFEYSNSGFALLGIVIERVTGQTYGDYLRQHVFAPAGMSNSGVDPAPMSSLALGMTSMQHGTRSPLGSGAPAGSPQVLGQTPSAASRGGPSAPGMVLIGPDGKRITSPLGEVPNPGQGMVLIGPHGERIAPRAAGGPLHPAPGAAVYGTPAGGVFSSAVDMQKFMSALLANRLTKPATTLAFTTLKVTPRGNPPGSGYGYGLGIRQDRGREWVGHNGGTLGANSEIFVDRSTDLSVAVITNRDPPSATRMFSYIKDLLADPSKADQCGGGTQGKSVPSVAGPREASRMRMMQVSPSIPDAVTGDEAGLPMTFTAGVPTLETTINGKGPFRLAFDTGAPGGPHLTSALAGALALQPAGEMMVGDPSGKNPASVSQYRLESVGFGAVLVQGWMATAMPTRPGKPNGLDGAVGLDAFAGFVVTIDYPHRRFALRRGALPPADGKSVFSYQGQMAPTVPLTVENRTILAHLDTGNTVAGVIVPAAFVDGLQHRSAATASGSAHTVTNVVQMFTVPIEGKARVGAVDLAVSAASYPALIPVANIGSPALMMTIIEVDPANERVRLSSAKE